MLKVLEVISDTNVGGAGVLLHARLKYSTAFSYTVLLPKNSALKKRFIRDGIKCIEMTECCDRSFDIDGIFEIARIIKKIKPDIINTHGCISARIAAFMCGVDVRIYTRHCAFDVSKAKEFLPFRKIFCLSNMLLSHHIIAVAEAAKNNLIKLGAYEKQISVIINGVEGITALTADEKRKIRIDLGYSEDDIIISICARLEACKDHATFLSAAAYLCKKSEKYKFIIIGDGSLKSKLEITAKRLGIKNEVRFTGFVENVSPYLNITDIQINCSIGTETSSLALSEGMSIGIPSVASDFGGNPYMVENGINGFLYKKGDAHDLAKKIEMMANDRELYKKMSVAAKKRFVSELNIKNTARRTEALYGALYRKIMEK